MKTEKQLKELLSDLEGAIRLRDNGVVSMKNVQHIYVLRKIDFLKEVLEIEEKKQEDEI